MDRYACSQELGRGAFGQVYMAHDRDTGKQVVMKKVHCTMLSEAGRKKAQAEAKILKSLAHCNVVAYVDALEDREHLYIIMEYCDGGDLRSYLAQRNSDLMPEAEILKLFLQLCIAVEYVHGKKVLHRDIKPANILMTKKGILKLCDFGIAKELNSSLELARTCVGTPCYASPEIWRAMEYNRKSDIWSLGCVLHEMTTLKPSFNERNQRMLLKKITKAEYSPVPPRYSRDLQNLIRRMLNRDASKRPPAKEIRETSIIQLRIKNYLLEVKGDDEEHVKVRGVLREALVPPNADNAKTATPTPHAHGQLQLRASISPAVNRDRPSLYQQRLVTKNSNKNKSPRHERAATVPFLSKKYQKQPKRQSQENRQQHLLANVAARRAMGQMLTTNLEKRGYDDQCNIKLNTGKQRSSSPRLPRSLSGDKHASKNNSPQELNSLSEVGARAVPAANSSASDGSSSLPDDAATARREDTESRSQNQDAYCRTRAPSSIHDGLSTGRNDIVNPEIKGRFSWPLSMMRVDGTSEVLGNALSVADLTCEMAKADLDVAELPLDPDCLNEVTTDANSRCERNMRDYFGTANQLDGCEAGELRAKSHQNASCFLRNNGRNPSTSVADGSYNNCISGEPRFPSTMAVGLQTDEDDIFVSEDGTGGTPHDAVSSSDGDSEAVDCDGISAATELRTALEWELGASILNQSYRLILSTFEDDSGNMAECERAVVQLLGPDRGHLCEKLLELVIADISFFQEDDEQGQQPTGQQ